jgi:hypothetical protein
VFGVADILYYFSESKSFSAAERETCINAGWDLNSDPGPILLTNLKTVRVWIIPEFFYTPLWSRYRGAPDVPSEIDAAKWASFRSIIERPEIPIVMSIFHDKLIGEALNKHPQVLSLEVQQWQSMFRLIDNFLFIEDRVQNVKYVILDGKLYLY